MKTLFLLRHAKSSWSNPELKDFERPLSERGFEDVPIMAQRFQHRNSSVDCIICSPATRARTTATLFGEAIGFTKEDIISNPELYFAGSAMFLKAAATLLVGHNPAITEFVNEMANCRIDNIPTCGIAELQVPIDAWSDITMGQAKLVEFDFPKKPVQGT